MTSAPQLSLLDPPVEPTVGRTRRSDPATSVAAGRSARVAFQRSLIARLLLTRDYVTADDVWEADLRDCRPDRSSYSTRLGGLCDDTTGPALLERGDPVIRADRHGKERLVVTYWPTPAGRRWVRERTSERVA